MPSRLARLTPHRMSAPPAARTKTRYVKIPGLKAVCQLWIALIALSVTYNVVLVLVLMLRPALAELKRPVLPMVVASTPAMSVRMLSHLLVLVVTLVVALK